MTVIHGLLRKNNVSLIYEVERVNLKAVSKYAFDTQAYEVVAREKIRLMNIFYELNLDGFVKK